MGSPGRMFRMLGPARKPIWSMSILDLELVSIFDRIDSRFISWHHAAEMVMKFAVSALRLAGMDREKALQAFSGMWDAVSEADAQLDPKEEA